MHDFLVENQSLRNDYKTAGLKKSYISNKIIVLQCPWIRKLLDNYFHEWKLVQLYLIEKCFGSLFKFDLQIYSLRETKLSFSHLSINKSFCTEKTSCYDGWNTAFCLNIYGIMQILREIKLLFNFHGFSEINIHYVSQRFNDNGLIKK